MELAQEASWLPKDPKGSIWLSFPSAGTASSIKYFYMVLGVTLGSSCLYTGSLLALAPQTLITLSGGDRKKKTPRFPGRALLLALKSFK